MLQYQADFVDFAEEMIPDIAVMAATAARDISEAERETRRQAWESARGKA
jgi:hypothetical protein